MSNLDGTISRLVYGLVSHPATGLAEYRGAREQTIALIRDLTQSQSDFRPARQSVYRSASHPSHLALPIATGPAATPRLPDLPQ